ncbi:AraC family transcriptional regulator [Actinoplanes sp. NPDC051470]|uniref:AraC family transcriptional regulator n=1 Tax=Actinoplanes sp. NPDC051470 TaxID=3157224 RepID=UPI003418D20E
MLDELADVVARHSVPIWVDTMIPRLTLVRMDSSTDPHDMLYEPMVCFVAAGAKRIEAGDLSWRTGAGTMFLSSLEVPITAMFDQVPYRSVVLRLDGRVLSDLLLELGGTPPREAPGAGGMSSAPVTPALIDAVLRWVRLLDTPGDIPALAGRIEGEILYRLLTGPLGPTLRQFTLADSRVAQVRTAAQWIRRHFREPLTVEAVAAAGQMSVASLYRHFKAATGMSPVQFQKLLRLQEARRLLVSGQVTAAGAAGAVGYASATQFNREYNRQYGISPGRDTAMLRSRLAVDAVTSPSAGS